MILRVDGVYEGKCKATWKKEFNEFKGREVRLFTPHPFAGVQGPTLRVEGIEGLQGTHETCAAEVRGRQGCFLALQNGAGVKASLAAQGSGGQGLRLRVEGIGVCRVRLRLEGCARDVVGVLGRACCVQR